MDTINAESKAYDDLWKIDPNVVDKLLSQDLMKLSLNDRNNIQEEIHGVKCRAIEETPELVDAALHELAYIIDEQTPDHEKKAYLQSQQLAQDNTTVLSGHALPGSTYVNESDFRLRFLRCELFDIRKAAQRMLKFLDIALELFGEYALRRPIRLSDFSKEEIRCMKKGRYQILPNRDRSGRRVFVMFPENEECRSPPITKAKILFYTSWALGHNDVESQRKGHVLVCWYGNNHSNSLISRKQSYPFDQLKSTRLSALHICSPDTPYYRIRRSIAVMRAGTANHSILRTHLGEVMEIQYALRAVGIPTDYIPISWSSKIKTKYLRQWMRVRSAIEQYDELLHFYSNGTQQQQALSIGAPSCGIVECPQPYDVLFRKGNAYVDQPGNGNLRTMIEEQSSISFIKRPKQLSHDIFQALQVQRSANVFGNGEAGSTRIGRYLVWDSQNDWWNEMNDKEQICQKIEYMIREHRKSVCNNGQKRNTKVSNKNSIVLSSATTMFQSQDDPLSYGFCNANSNKRQRHGFDPYTSSGSSSSSSSEDEHPN